MEKKDTKQVMRVTNCIKERFEELLINESNGATAEQVENYAHNCALALDFIGAGKIAEGQAKELLTRCINDEFASEAELLDYIANVRSARKKRVMSEETKKKNDAKILLKRGYNTKQVSDFLGMSEAVVIEIATELNK